MAAAKEEKGVSLFTAEDSGTFEAVSAQREGDGHETARSHDQEGGPARYKEPGLTTPEVRETAKALRVARDLRKSSAMAEKTNKNREEYKKQLEDEVERKFKSRELRKKEMLLKWSKKLDRSSFLVDQVAESERIDEEQRVKLEEEAKRAKLFEERKQRIKTEIILKALAETNDLDQLRQEKRLIVEEERRLKVAAGQTHKKDCIAEKEEKMKTMQEERRRRNEQHLMQQKNRLAMQQMEEEKRREAILMKMQMKYGGSIPGEPNLT
uniref:Trichohyalin-plectin-homology domain-containing protein n=1 Tax=Hemiselmis tepida TaxID=464990 RepID=A0A7S0WBM1_9CRYP|mmetsp:Transcript_4285/g.11021  ORF Transcript_4285/g.11021 Transcript_4285/m.11021 type:complete len:267 (+) Transcript_4285:216-1016(+)